MPYSPIEQRVQGTQREAGYIGNMVCAVQLTILQLSIALIQSVSSPFGKSTLGVQSLLEPFRDGEDAHPSFPRLERWPYATALEASGLPPFRQLRCLPHQHLGMPRSGLSVLAWGDIWKNSLGGSPFEKRMEEQRGEKNLQDHSLSPLFFFSGSQETHSAILLAFKRWYLFDHLQFKQTLWAGK